MKEVVSGRVWQGLGSGYDCNAFVVRGDHQTILVDSGTHIASEKVKKIVSEFDIAAILLTHGHLDHVGGAALAVQEIQVPLWASFFTADKLEAAEQPHIDPFFGSSIPPIEIARRIKEGDTLDLGGIRFKVLETPGHTAGSICLYEPIKRWLFSGDTVFADGSFGRTDLRSGSSPQLIDSLHRLTTLSIDALFPGHMRSVLIGAAEHIAESYQIAKKWLI
jgi:hydroxyacylglutathione hydrolase